MRAPAAFQLTVTRFVAWRAALGVLAAALGSVLLAWCVQATTAPYWPIAMLCGTGAVLLLGWLARIQPFSLRWDGQCWHLGPQALRGAEPVAGHLGVALDLGWFLLLRFSPEGPRAVWRHQWLPIERAGHQAAWHTLRYSVFAHQTLRETAVADEAGLAP